jgi:hypothetical protein
MKLKCGYCDNETSNKYYDCDYCDEIVCKTCLYRTYKFGDIFYGDSDYEDENDLERECIHCYDTPPPLEEDV